MITIETFCGASEDDPLKSGTDKAAELIPNSTKGLFPNETNEEGLSVKADMIRNFLQD